MIETLERGTWIQSAAKIEKTRIGRWPDKKWLAEFRAKAPALAVAAE